MRAFANIKLGIIFPEATFANSFVQSDKFGTENLLITIKSYHKVYFIKIFTINY